MSYTIRAPLPRLRGFSKKDVKAYFEWFLSIIPERLQALPVAVTRTPGFDAWRADFTPDSLGVLGVWFAGQVGTRKRTQQEMAGILTDCPYPIDIPEDELTDDTFSAVHDVGIYLAEVLRHQYPVLQWQQVLGSKNNVYFGLASLSGFGKIDFSPVSLVTVLAYGLVDKTYDDKRLRYLYDTWSKMIVS